MPRAVEVVEHWHRGREASAGAGDNLPVLKDADHPVNRAIKQFDEFREREGACPGAARSSAMTMASSSR